MTVAMFCLREPPPRDEQPMMAARALATLRAHFVRPTRRLRRGRIPAIAAIATATMALHTVRGLVPQERVRPQVLVGGGSVFGSR